MATLKIKARTEELMKLIKNSPTVKAMDSQDLNKLMNIVADPDSKESRNIHSIFLHEQELLAQNDEKFGKKMNSIMDKMDAGFVDAAKQIEKEKSEALHDKVEGKEQEEAERMLKNI